MIFWLCNDVRIYSGNPKPNNRSYPRLNLTSSGEIFRLLLFPWVQAHPPPLLNDQFTSYQTRYIPLLTLAKSALGCKGSTQSVGLKSATNPINQTLPPERVISAESSTICPSIMRLCSNRLGGTRYLAISSVTSTFARLAELSCIIHSSFGRKTN